MDNSHIQSNSASWIFFIKVSFSIALIAMGIGIIFMPGGLVIQGYFAICSLFLVSATITLSKTLRDEHESQRLISKINEAKTNKILNEFSD
ncbi:hypothetical protein FM038_023175 [Shewanella eurypsychrophilus]|uniref:YiaAB two helix domain-containing protein n=1 Tax=Shewanella eurypsychrophilus TaxID=2593656 RepID=A0ABX6VB77_9GAMM|nr:MULTISPECIES: YiaA/YiaB family inner membrane protein [Shewanella]QFU24745.1 hypothetical protein FS418_24835 [Shewanella sp. YLB-09]QPG59935.1 hypothetical protein FM038_023175 [Shewanella eurypsychrophilus]